MGIVNYGKKIINGKQEVDSDKWVDLRNLNRKNGKNKNIDWSNCIGLEVDFKYLETEGKFNILNYDKESKKLLIKFKEREFYITTTHFTGCKFGKLLGVISDGFKVEIYQKFKDDKRDLIITDRKYIENKEGMKRKCVKYKCNKCGWDCNGKYYRNGIEFNEMWMAESDLINGQGCSCCLKSPQITVPNINSIQAKERWMFKYLLNKEDGFKYTPNSHQKIYFKCPYCGSVTNKIISSVKSATRLSCHCGDGFSYPEKYIYSVLKECNISFITQLNKSLKNWCNAFYYDFYIPDLNIIIETHGEQHYIQTNRKTSKRNLKEEQENDRAKRELALKNGVKYYIELDCRKSDLEWIKNSLLNSELNNLFDLSNVDWNKCEEFASKNIVKEVCNYWNNKEEYETTKDLATIFNVSNTTIRNYLNKGTVIGFCNYDGKKEARISSSKSGIKSGKPIEVFREGISFGIFRSSSELARISESELGTKLFQSNISAVANGQQKSPHKGFTFKYVDTNKEEIA